MSAMYEGKSPSSGWAKRRKSSSRQSSSPPESLPPATPVTRQSCNTSSGSGVCLAVKSVETNSTMPNRQLAKVPLRYIAVFLAVALLLTLGDSFFMTIKLISSEASPHLPPALKTSNGDQETSQTTNAENVRRHGVSSEERLMLKSNSQQRQQEISPHEMRQSAIHRAQLAIAQNLSLMRSTDHDLSSTIKSCQFEDCRNLQSNDKLVFYNSLDRPRYLCGEMVPAKGSLVLNSPCPNQCHSQRLVLATLFPILPTVANQQSSSSLPPIQLGIRGVKPSRSTRFAPFKSCDVKCSFLPNNLNSQSIARTIVGTDWEIVSSMEGPEYYQSLLQQSDSNHFSSTTSLDSDVPLPYFSWDDYAPNMRADVPGVDYDKAIKGAVFMARNCQSKNGREGLVRDMIQLSSQNASSSEQLRVDSISKCLHNHDAPPTKVKDDKNEIMSTYLFYLAFENQNAKDYITEKLWASLFRSGAVPIYLGAANVADHVPPHSIIVVRDFQDIQSFWKYLVQVANNRTLYESYHAWRNKPLPDTFIEKYNFTHTHSTCRMARWAFAKLYGWGWDHVSQTVQEANVHNSRKLCWANANGMLSNPFRERWLSHTFHELQVQREQMMTGESFGEDSACYNPGVQTENQTQSVTVVGSLRRTVWSHDGIVDLSMEPINNAMVGRTVVLEMGFPLLMDTKGRTSWNRMGHFEFWLQRGNLRITILTSHTVVLSSPSEGVIQVFIQVPKYSDNSFTHADNEHDQDQKQRDASFRMRVVVEQVDTRRNAQAKSFFGKLAAEDFFQPVERFLVSSKNSAPNVGEQRT